ncbi:hypothetical protein [Chitinasiproducens palmae]|uniref:Uncharacterized protein n=1 Tax=Chitinasiproducens palmae TaxID=1770053 RepID=A0A1H2PQT7_9BURK|nr:hypothetical protein [Chitinasiproducens palmae]SDV49225.1 hypothetical protein SAMN05216551_107165 [Chitinasiproducens palmae]
MPNGRKTVEVDLPEYEADQLNARAQMESLAPARYLGVHVLRSAYGPLHPEVIAYERRDDLGQVGTLSDGGDRE